MKKQIQTKPNTSLNILKIGADFSTCRLLCLLLLTAVQIIAIVQIIAEQIIAKG